jgi:hypothetical protein
MRSAAAAAAVQQQHVVVAQRQFVWQHTTQAVWADTAAQQGCTSSILNAVVVCCVSPMLRVNALSKVHANREPQPAQTTQPLPDVATDTKKQAQSINRQDTKVQIHETAATSTDTNGASCSKPPASPMLRVNAVPGYMPMGNHSRGGSRMH